MNDWNFTEFNQAFVEINQQRDKDGNQFAGSMKKIVSFIKVSASSMLRSNKTKGSSFLLYIYSKCSHLAFIQKYSDSGMQLSCTIVWSHDNTGDVIITAIFIILEDRRLALQYSKMNSKNEDPSVFEFNEIYQSIPPMYKVKRTWLKM